MVIFTIFILGLLYAVRKVLKLRKLIKGDWFNYSLNWFLLKRYAKSHPKDRLRLHDLFDNELEHMGYVPFEQELEYSKPKKVVFFIFVCLQAFSSNMIFYCLESN